MYDKLDRLGVNLGIGGRYGLCSLLDHRCTAMDDYMEGPIFARPAIVNQCARTSPVDVSA